jgi:hypothetical protein
LGLYGVNADPTLSGDPSSRLNIIGVGLDAADSTIHLIHNDGTGSATHTDTGLTLTAATVYTLVLSCPGSGGDITVQLFTRDSAGLTSVYGPILVTTDLPATNLFLICVAMANSGAETTQGLICFHEWGLLV